MEVREPTTEIVSLLPEANGLTSVARSRLCDFLETKLAPQAFRIHLSPYHEHEFSDPFGVTGSYPHAVVKWLSQFPEPHRLGLLIGLLNLTYLTASEERAFFDLLQARLLESLADRDARDVSEIYPSISPVISHRLRPYAISAFGHFDYFTKGLRIDALRDRDVMPFRHLADNAIEQLSSSIDYLASTPFDPGGYHWFHKDILLAFIRSCLSTDLLLIEDCSFSGTRVGGKAAAFIRILEILFPESLQPLLNESQLKAPHVHVAVSYATTAAASKFSPEGLRADGKVTHSALTSITGFEFGPDASMSEGLPRTFRPLAEIFPSLDLYQVFRSSCAFFLENYGKYYLEETGVAKGANISASDLLFGFKNGGWAITSERNTPNNSLTFLWYPHTRSKLNSIQALFPRTDSKHSHEDGPSLQPRLRQLALGHESRFGQWLSDLYRRHVCPPRLR